ncbi:CSE2-domain-containing protein [Mollisia scopiformis]|uniref:Mediator of RNA polymerase II transcription subunit 21 n=1 Tax=Mollisia scopiformis TaxID=149040 RepID=A0A194X9I8_MOLSC|nr:CSE2-domain-containing protein [Mollisia scopiformis]KUJ16826.1 CSE2-domain-containing protein [Mollisia scopiformis]
MADMLTQLQDAVDQLAQQFVASLHYVNKHHDYALLGPTDRLVTANKNGGVAAPQEDEIDPKSEAAFKDGQRELARDIIIKEQQIEYLISQLPGLENSEKDQDETIRRLEEELKVAEEERKEAVKERAAVLAKLETVIRSVKRP